MHVADSDKDVCGICYGPGYEFTGKTLLRVMLYIGGTIDGSLIKVTLVARKVFAAYFVKSAVSSVVRTIGVSRRYKGR